MDSVRRVLIILRIGVTATSSKFAPFDAPAVMAGAAGALVVGLAEIADNTSDPRIRPSGPLPFMLDRFISAPLFFRIVFAKGLMSTRSGADVAAGVAAGAAGVAAGVAAGADGSGAGVVVTGADGSGAGVVVTGADGSDAAGAAAGASPAPSDSIESFVALAKAAISSLFSTTIAIGSPMFTFSDPSGIRILATKPYS